MPLLLGIMLMHPCKLFARDSVSARTSATLPPGCLCRSLTLPKCKVPESDFPKM